MRDFLLLLVHFLVTAARLTRPGGLRSVAIESVLLRHCQDALISCVSV